jgi:RNA polymerase sigma factor (sigma-70 family)
MDDSGAAEARARFARILDGDADAWAALTDQYTNLLWSIGRGLRLSHADTAEAVQITWLRLVESMDRVRQPEYVGSWLATTMRRESLAVLRRSTREQVGALDEWQDLADGSAELDDALLREERDAALWRAFGRLTPACQALLRVLIAEPRPSYAEVSEALGVPVGSIGPTRQRCLASLRTFMQSGTW